MLGHVPALPHARRRDASASHYVTLGIQPRGAVQTTVELARRTLGFGAAMLNVIDATQQHTLSQVGLPGCPVIDRARSACDEVVRTGRPSVLHQIPAHLSHGPTALGGFRSYLGVPLRGREGLVIGTLCLLDYHPRTVTDQHAAQLSAFATIAEDQLDLVRRRHEAALDGALLPGALAGAIDDGELVPWYQPVIDLDSGSVIGLEALARWQHPTHGTLLPASFIRVAEDSDLIIDLDLTVLRRAMRDLARWRRWAPALRLNVNLSAKHLQSTDCVDALMAAATTAGVPPGAVDLEITETAAVGAGARSVEVLTQLREHGFRILLDDFGTGYSSFEHLLHLPVDGLKIDRSLTKELGSRNADAVVRALSGMCRDMGLTTVIEGVENDSTAWRARELGCTTAQGYLWSPAVPAERVAGLLRRQADRVSA